MHAAPEWLIGLHHKTDAVLCTTHPLRTPACTSVLLLFCCDTYVLPQVCVYVCVCVRGGGGSTLSMYLEFEHVSQALLAVVQRRRAPKEQQARALLCNSDIYVYF